MTVTQINNTQIKVLVFTKRKKFRSKKQIIYVVFFDLLIRDKKNGQRKEKKKQIEKKTIYELRKE